MPTTVEGRSAKAAAASPSTITGLRPPGPRPATIRRPGAPDGASEEGGKPVPRKAGKVQWGLRIECILFLTLAASLLAQQQPTQTVVVTGTFEPLTLEEIDRAIRVLPARSQALVFNSLVDLLRVDPSIDLEERAPDGVQTDVSIRGSSFGETLVLLNGQRLNDAQSGHHNMDIPVP